MTHALRTLPRYQAYLSRTAAVLAGLCAVSVFLYGIFLLLAVEHTASRSAAQNQINTLTAQLGTLETQYLGETQNITPQTASALGFVAPVEVSTVFAGKSASTLTLRTTP